MGSTTCPSGVISDGRLGAGFFPSRKAQVCGSLVLSTKCVSFQRRCWVNETIDVSNFVKGCPGWC